MTEISDIITASRLKTFCPKMRADILEEILTSAPVLFPKAGITTPLVIAHILAQFASEASAFTRLDENLYYTTASLLVKNWPSKFPNVAAAQPYLKNPEKLANHVYGQKNGNHGGTDGWDYRGSGLIQLTGRTNFRNAGGATLENDPDLARRADSALAYALDYWTRHKINAAATGATQSDVANVTKLINPYDKDITRRWNYFRAAQRIFTAASSGATASVATTAGTTPSQGSSAQAGHGPHSSAASAAHVGASAVESGANAELSGAQWVVRYPTSREISDMKPPFDTAVAGFVGSLRDGGATVRISATVRPPERAYLMHFAWLIAKKEIDPAQASPMPGVAISWVHATLDLSRKAAAAMVAAYGIVSRPALNSRHTEGRAVDMTISWQGSLKLRRKSGQTVTIADTPRNGSNPTLVKVGAEFGVIKLLTDPPHWSDDGR